MFQRQPYLPATTPLHRIAAVKAWPGLLGSGMSYKFAINSAKLSGLAQITLCEDDVEFPPAFESDYRIVLEYLSTLEQWDVFVGLIADVDNSTRVLDVEKYRGLEFVTIDKFSSTVFNIYNASSYDRILGWGDDDRGGGGDGGGGNDGCGGGSASDGSSAGHVDSRPHFATRAGNPSSHSTIKPLTIVTTNPSIFGHMELGSTSWGSGREYPEWFATSARVFAESVEDFKRRSASSASIFCKEGGGSCRRRRRQRRPYHAKRHAVAGNGGNGVY